MSKKDLLERLTRTPADPLRPARREEEGGAARLPSEPAVQTRVAARVVRRRRVESEEPGPPVPPPTTVRRRAAAVVPSEGEGAGRVEPSAPAVAATPSVETPAADSRVRRKPGKSAPPAAEPQREAQGPAAEPAPAPAAEPAPAEPAPQAVREPEPERAPAAAEARTEPEPVPARQPAAERVQEQPERRVAARAEERPAPVEAAAPPQPPQLQDTPRYAGLGKAVVMPPPGYDPTNPLAFRRKQEAERSVTEARRGPNRRRVEPGGTTDRPAEYPRASDAPGGPPRRRRGGPAPHQHRMDRPVRSKRKRVGGGTKAPSPAPKAAKRKVRVDNVISVGQLAHELGVKAPVVIRQLMELGMMASITQMLDIETAALVASEFDYEVENVGFQEANFLEAPPEAAEEEGLVRRPPVVTIMGHVDHGKTTLLDTIRKSRVAAGEAGGITQHIGAYQVETDQGTITFIDTPGHAAFTAMRARGAQVTDIVVLVVAADDGVQPQTLEAIAHAKAASVPIVVAVNKMDKAGASAEPIMTRLSEQGLVPEAWGGDTMYVPLSALKAEGIDDLLEAILLQSEVLDLKANPDRFAEGIVLEAKMERGRGAVATVLVQKGTLKRGDHVVLGSAFGKVRAIVDHRGNNIKEAPPSTPVELFGLSELPEVGDTVHTVKSEQNARTLAEHRAQQKREIEMTSTRRATQQDIFDRAAAADRVVFEMILKADVGGSLQALKAAIENIQVPGAEVRILHHGVGDLSESDVSLAAANGAHLIGFNVRFDARGRQAAAEKGVEAEFYTVIYDVLDRVERGLKGMLAPVYEQVRQGSVEVRQLFRISKVGVVAGSYVLDGKIARNHTARVVRDGTKIWEGKVQGLKRFKEDVREVGAGYECGVSLEGFTDIREGDLIEAYAEQVVAQT